MLVLLSLLNSLNQLHVGRDECCGGFHYLPYDNCCTCSSFKHGPIHHCHVACRVGECDNTDCNATKNRDLIIVRIKSKTKHQVRPELTTSGQSEGDQGWEAAEPPTNMMRICIPTSENTRQCGIGTEAPRKNRPMRVITVKYTFERKPSKILNLLSRRLQLTELNIYMKTNALKISVPNSVSFLFCSKSVRP